MTIRVLLVDDEPEVTAALRVVLRPYRFDIFTAASGFEGLRVLEETEVDVVVSDERMAGMSGAEFLVHVRSRYPDIARVVLTGRASMDETLAAINEAEVFRYLRKPSSAADLAQCIQEAAATTAASRRRRETSRDIEREDRTFDEALGTIEVWFQPILDRDQQLVAHEALLRTSHLTLGDPELLIAAAREPEHKMRLDRAVRAQVASRIAHGHIAERVFVNLLPETLFDPTFVDDDDPLHSHAEMVTLEITERASLSELGDVNAPIRKLRARGYQIALDDLGAGYAGLTSFSALEPDVVKFDLELVRDIDSRPWSTRLVASMVEVCRKEGVVTIGEGVETPAELDTLLSLGVDLVQGHLLGKPAPLSFPSER